MKDPVKTLECSVCGRECKGRQWFNRDKGYGICPKCVEHEIRWCVGIKMLVPEVKEYMRSTYGNQGYHYFKEEQHESGLQVRQGNEE